MVNRVILIGNVGQDPEIRMSGTTKIASFSLATSERWKDKNGENQEKTEWHSVSVFGNSASFVEEYVKKGSQLFVEGKIRYSKSEDRYYTNIVADNLKLLGRREERREEGDSRAKVTHEEDNGDIPEWMQ